MVPYAVVVIVLFEIHWIHLVFKAGSTRRSSENALGLGYR